MLATARPTLTDGVAPGLGRMNNARPADMKPDQAAGILKAPKIKIKFKGLVVVDKVITEADTGAAMPLPTSDYLFSACLDINDLLQRAVGGSPVQVLSLGNLALTAHC